MGAPDYPKVPAPPPPPPDLSDQAIRDAAAARSRQSQLQRGFAATFLSGGRAPGGAGSVLGAPAAAQQVGSKRLLGQ